MPAMTPLDPTRTVWQRAFRTGRMETWESASLDGTWLYVRIEDTGTYWDVEHIPTKKHECFTSLPKARRWTAEKDAAAVPAPPVPAHV